MVTEEDQVFVLTDGFWRRTTPFMIQNDKNLTIIQMSAGYHHLILLLENKRTRQRKVLACCPLLYPYSFSFGVRKNTHGGEYITFSRVNFSTRKTNQKKEPVESRWFEPLDFDEYLEAGEYVSYTSCAAFTSVFITSRGRLFACGSNQFGEVAQKQLEKIEKINECDLDENNEAKNPFFVKTVNGDHNIIALTRDGKVFYCGFQLEINGVNVLKMREFKTEMDTDEYFIDIAATYYGIVLLSSEYFYKFSSLQTLLQKLILIIF